MAGIKCSTNLVSRLDARRSELKAKTPTGFILELPAGTTGLAPAILVLEEKFK